MSAHTHWMRLNVGDYLADTLHLSALQHGMYILLILHYFRRGELPDTESAIARIARCPSSYLWRKCGPAVMALFQRVDDRWRHKRVDAELELARQVTAIKQQAGRKGADARYRKRAPPDAKNFASAEYEFSPSGNEQVVDFIKARDSNCHRETEPEPKQKKESPPVRPPSRGGWRTNGGYFDSRTPMPARNAACALFVEMRRRGENP